MCRIDSQLNKLIRLKYFILETHTFFSIFSWYFTVLHTLNVLSSMFVFPTLKKNIFKYF